MNNSLAGWLLNNSIVITVCMHNTQCLMCHLNCLTTNQHHDWTISMYVSTPHILIVFCYLIWTFIGMKWNGIIHMISNNQASLFADLMLIYNERTKKKWLQKSINWTAYIVRRSLDVRPMKFEAIKLSLLSYRQHKLVTIPAIKLFVHCIVLSLWYFLPPYTIWAVIVMMHVFVYSICSVLSIWHSL